MRLKSARDHIEHGGVQRLDELASIPRFRRPDDDGLERRKSRNAQENRDADADAVNAFDAKAGDRQILDIHRHPSPTHFPQLRTNSHHTAFGCPCVPSRRIVSHGLHRFYYG